MAVRQFDGVDDDIRHAIGALAGMQYGTFAALLKVQAPTGEYGTILSLVTSGNVLRVQWYYDEGVEWHNIFVPDRSTQVPLTGYGNQWALLVARKASGSVPVTFSLYRFNQGQWSHGNSSNFANWTSPGANGIVARSFVGDEYFRGLIAVQAVWANRVPFANNAAVEAAGLEESLQAWFDAEPDALWAFNQESVTDPVNDLTGNGADQIARTGTAVVTNDDPPGFDWGDEPAIVGSGEATLPAVAGSGSGAVLVDGSGEAALPGIVAEGVGVVVDTGIIGSGEATIPPLTAQGAGAALVDGSGQAVLPAYAGEGAGAVLIEGVGESALPAIAASGAGTVYTPEIFGFGEATFAAFVADGAGDVLVFGSGEATVPALVAAGRGFQGEPPEHRAGSEQTVLRRRGFSTTALRS